MTSYERHNVSNQSTGKSAVCSTTCSGYKKKNTSKFNIRESIGFPSRRECGIRFYVRTSSWKSSKPHQNSPNIMKCLISVNPIYFCHSSVARNYTVTYIGPRFIEILYNKQRSCISSTNASVVFLEQFCSHCIVNKCMGAFKIY